MKSQKPMRVKHPKYGRGYVLIIGEDSFGVKFWPNRQRYFSLSAIEDGTLIASDETINQFHARHKALLEWATSERAKKASDA